MFAPAELDDEHIVGMGDTEHGSLIRRYLRLESEATVDDDSEDCMQDVVEDDDVFAVNGVGCEPLNYEEEQTVTEPPPQYAFESTDVQPTPADGIRPLPRPQSPKALLGPFPKRGMQALQKARPVQAKSRPPAASLPCHAATSAASASAGSTPVASRLAPGTWAPWPPGPIRAVVRSLVGAGALGPTPMTPSACSTPAHPVSSSRSLAAAKAAEGAASATTSSQPVPRAPAPPAQPPPKELLASQDPVQQGAASSTTASQPVPRAPAPPAQPPPKELLVSQDPVQQAEQILALRRTDPNTAQDDVDIIRWRGQHGLSDEVELALRLLEHSKLQSLVGPAGRDALHAKLAGAKDASAVMLSTVARTDSKVVQLVIHIAKLQEKHKHEGQARPRGAKALLIADRSRRGREGNSAQKPQAVPPEHVKLHAIAPATPPRKAAVKTMAKAGDNGPVPVGRVRSRSRESAIPPRKVTLQAAAEASDSGALPVGRVRSRSRERGHATSPKEDAASLAGRSAGKSDFEAVAPVTPPRREANARGGMATTAARPDEAKIGNAKPQDDGDIEGWLKNLDPSGNLSRYLPALKREFGKLSVLLELRASSREGSTFELKNCLIEEPNSGKLIQCIEPELWNSVEIMRLGHRLLIAKGIVALHESS